MQQIKSGIYKWLTISFNTSILDKKRIQWVDYLRGIAIILVVYRHTLIGIERTGLEIPSYLERANMIFYSFRMPLFFIIAGIFISKSISKKKFSELILVKFENLLYPYFIWCTIQIGLQILLSRYTNSNRTFIDFTYLFYHPRALDQFWYLPALFNTSLLFILIRKKLNPNPYIHLLFATSLYFLSPYINGISIISDLFEFYIFFVIGDIISKHFFDDNFLRKFGKKQALLILIPLFIIVQYSYLSNNEYYYLNDFYGQIKFIFIALIGCITMFSIAYHLQINNLFPFLRIVGFHSLYIYVIHVLVIAFMRILFINFLGITSSILLLFIGLVIGIIVPIIFYNQFVKGGIGWFLFHFRKRNKA